MQTVSPTESEKSQRGTYSFIRFFDDSGPASLEELGGKGYALAKMTAAGLPVPLGFTIKATQWRAIYYNTDPEGLPAEVEKEIIGAMRELQNMTGKYFGNPDAPLTYSLRSGAKVSMPGMMKTILNLGITDKTLPGLIFSIGEPAALDAYQRLIRMYSSSVYGIDHSTFRTIEEHLGREEPTASSVEHSRHLVNAFKSVVQIETGHQFEQDVWRQLKLGTRAIANSFMDPGAIEYRMAHGISHDIGTAVHVQEMVYGNANERSGTAVVFTRDPRSGERKLAGHYLPQEQGEAVVRGDRIGLPLETLPKAVREQIAAHVEACEKIVGSASDIEVTWEYRSGMLKVYFLQVRVARLSPIGTIASAIDMEREGLMTPKQALSRVNSGHIDAVLRPHLDTRKPTGLQRQANASGDPLRTGAGVGCVYFNVERAKSAVREGKQVVLICSHFDPNDIELIVGSRSPDGSILRAQAICTTEGTPSSHMGIIMTEAGIPGIMGISGVSVADDGLLMIGEKAVSEGEILSIDGDDGNIYLGEIPLRAVELSPSVVAFIRRWKRLFGEQNQWADFIDHESEEHIVLARKTEVVVASANALFASHKKAQQVYLESQILPPDIHIHSEVLPITDIEAIRSAVTRARENGCSVWARSDNGELRAPYTSGDLTVPDIFDDWIKNPDSTHSKWGGLERWQRDHKVAYVMIGFDPREKLDKRFRQEHFVGTVRCLSAIPPQIVVDVRDQTNLLRSMDEATPNDRIRLTVVANPLAPEKRGVPIFNFGENHYDAQKLDQILATMTSYPSSSKTHRVGDIVRKHSDPESISELTKIQLSDQLSRLLQEGLLPPTLFDAFITERATQVAKFIYQTLFEDWWKNMNMPALLWSLREATGASVLEFQGRIPPNGRNWLKIYGTKGGEESHRVRTGRASH